MIFKFFSSNKDLLFKVNEELKGVKKNQFY